MPPTGHLGLVYQVQYETWGELQRRADVPRWATSVAISKRTWFLTSRAGLSPFSLILILAIRASESSTRPEEESGRWGKEDELQLQSPEASVSF
jgi:hypothetical protein